MICECEIEEELFDFNNKKFFKLKLKENSRRSIEIIQKNSSRKILNDIILDPLNGDVLTVKVPYRYNRVMCKVEEKPIQSLKVGDRVQVQIDFTGVWNVGCHSGYTWKLKELKYIGHT